MTITCNWFAEITYYIIDYCSVFFFGKTYPFLFNIEWIISYNLHVSHDFYRSPVTNFLLLSFYNLVSYFPNGNESLISLSFIKSSCWLWRQGTAGMALWKWESTTSYLLRHLAQFCTSDPWVSFAAQSILVFASQCYTVTCFGFSAPCVPQHLKGQAASLRHLSLKRTLDSGFDYGSGHHYVD